MSELRARIRQAQRRLWLNRWLAKLGWSLTLAAAGFVLFIIFERMVLAFDDEGYILRRLAGGLGVAALLASIIWTLITRDSAPAAAARLDEAAHLKERLSTAVYFAGSADPFAQAAVADARNISRLVTPRMYLPVRVPRSAPYAGVSFIMAGLFFWLFPVVDLSGKQAAQQEERIKQQEVERVKVQVQPVMDKLNEIRKKHPELEKKAQEPDPLKLAGLDSPADLKKNALKEVNAAAARLQDKKNEAELAKVQEFKQMLRRLAAEPAPKSTVSMLSNALAKGDFKSAQEALSKIQQELAKLPESAQDQARAEQLRADLKKLADQLGKIAENDNKLKDQMRQMNLGDEEIKNLTENLSENKLDEMARKLAEKGLSQDQIDTLMKQAAKSAEAKKAASKLAQNLAKAAQQRAEGQPGEQHQKPGEQAEGESDDGLEQAAEQLSELESLEMELAELNAALADLQGLKDQFGDGLDALGEFGEGQEPGPGMGGPGQGQGGVAPKQETAVGFKAQRSRVHTGSGAIIDQRFVEGEQYRGEVTDDFVEAVLGAREDLTEVTRQKPLPRHIKLRQAEYFRQVESDLPRAKVDAAKQKLETTDQPEQN